MVFNISSFLEKFKGLHPPHDFIKAAFVSLLQEEFGVKIEKENLSIRGSVIFVECHPSLKSEIFVRKQRLLEKLAQSLALGSIRITDIR